MFQVAFVPGCEQLLVGGGEAQAQALCSDGLCVCVWVVVQSAGGDGAIKLWDLDSRSAAPECVLSLPHSQGLLGMGYDPIFHTIAGGCFGGDMHVWHLNHGQRESLNSWSVRELKDLLRRKAINVEAMGLFEKKDLVCMHSLVTHLSLTCQSPVTHLSLAAARCDAL